jgi:hypothetical protein
MLRLRQPRSAVCADSEIGVPLIFLALYGCRIEIKNVFGLGVLL